MGRLVKLLKYLVLLSLLVISAAAALVWFRGNALIAHYKTDIELALSEALGVSVSASQLQVSIYPHLGLKAGDVIIRRSEEAEPWKVAELDLAADLQALLHGEIELHSLEILGLEGTIKAETPATTAGGHRSSKPSVPVPARSSKDRPFVINLEELLVRNSRLTIKDEGTEWPLVLTEARAALSASGERLVISTAEINASCREVPFALHATQLSLTNSEAAVQHAAIRLGQEQLELSGAFGPERRISARLSTEKLNLGNLFSAIENISRSKPPSVSGHLSGYIALSGTPEFLNAAGTLAVGSLEAGGARLAALTIPGMTVIAAGKRLHSAKFNATVEGLEVAAGKHRYLAASGTIDASVRAEGGYKARGKLSTKGFGYNDGTTEVRDVDATASDIQLSVDSQGAVSAEMQIDGRSLALTAPSVEIRSVRKVSSPLRVSVPASGGYEISGPVSAEGGMLTVKGRELQELAGTVQILISKPLKVFQTQSLNVRSFGQNVSALGSFSMTPEEFKLQLTSLALGGGTASGHWVMGRGERSATTVQLNGSSIDLPQAFQAFMQRTGEIEGNLQSLSLSVTGERGRFFESATGSGAFVLQGNPPAAQNFRERMLAAIAALPGAGDLLGAQEELDRSQDRETSADFRIAGGKLYLQNLKAKRTGYNLEGEASIAINHAVEGRFMVILFKDTLSGLGLGMEPLRALFSRATRVSIPIEVTNTVEDPKVSLDYAKLAKNASGLGLAESVVEGIWDGGKRIVGVFSGKEQKPKPDAGPQ